MLVSQMSNLLQHWFVTSLYVQTNANTTLRGTEVNPIGNRTKGLFWKFLLLHIKISCLFVQWE